MNYNYMKTADTRLSEFSCHDPERILPPTMESSVEHSVSKSSISVVLEAVEDSSDKVSVAVVKTESRGFSDDFVVDGKTSPS